MKKNILFAMTFGALIGLSGCDSFLDLDPLDKVPADKLTATEGGMKGLLANIYRMAPMDDFNMRTYTGYNCHNFDGTNGIGSSAFLTDEASRSDGNSNHPEVWVSFGYWPYSDIRQVNLFIESVATALAKGSIKQADADRYQGEAHFIRGYIYMRMAMRYGGVPLVDHAQDSNYDPSNPGALRTPRSTETDTWKFVLNEFTKAAELLPTESSEPGRATKWAALGLKSRAALHAASLAKYWDKAPLYGEAVDQKLVGFSSGDAEYFYKECIAASESIIKHSGKSLYGARPKNVEEAIDNYQKLFLNTPSEEVIYARYYVDGTSNANQGHSWTQFNRMAQVGPGSLYWGRFNPTLDLVDVFEDYTDNGVGASVPVKTRTDNVENAPILGSRDAKFNVDNLIKYDDLAAPFKNKDARLQASIIVPGASYAGTKILIQGGLIEQDGKIAIYNNASAKGKDGNTYWAFGAEGSTAFSGFLNISEGGQNSNYVTTGFGVRKYMEEFKNLSSNDNTSTTPFIDVRLAEIFLNYAEAVVESGQGDNALAKECLNAIRHRAAHTDNIDLTLANVLKERRVELAFEGQRYWDMNRHRENHVFFNNGMRTALVPMLDLREATPKYVFVRTYLYPDENKNGRTFSQQNYYASIPGVATNGLVQNPGY